MQDKKLAIPDNHNPMKNVDDTFLHTLITISHVRTHIESNDKLGSKAHNLKELQQAIHLKHY